MTWAPAPASHRSGVCSSRWAMAPSSRISRATPTTSTLHPVAHEGSTSSTSKATTVFAEAVCRLVPSPVRKTIWPSSSR